MLRRGIAQVLVGLNGKGDAVAAFERILIHLPDDHAVLTGLADCYEAISTFEKMMACRIRLGVMD